MQSINRRNAKDTALGVLPIACLIAMLIVLAFLQLRWSAMVSNAESASLQQSLERSTRSFQAAFARDLLGISQTLQASEPRDPNVLADHLSDRYTVWRRITRHAAMIDGLYIWRASNNPANVLLKLNPQTHQLEPAAWPASLRVFVGNSYTLPESLQNRLGAWLWDEQATALIHPLYVTARAGDADHPRFYGYLYVAFNTQYFEQAYLPELGRRFFLLTNGFVFQLVDRQNVREPRVVYQSNKTFSTQTFLHPDAAIPLLDDSTIYRPGGAPASTEMMAPPNRVFLKASGTSRWQIAVQHHPGSVDVAEKRLRRRNLAVSLIVLLTLLVSMITILTASRRARRLAHSQMEFASGISHELRTPLAVIRSAAENLADGVISETARVREYGALIHKESRRLSGMLDHILDFAHLQGGEPGYVFETVTVTNILDRVLANENQLIQASGVGIELLLAADLPILFTDPEVLVQCLQNLLSKAVKYGYGGGTILLTAAQAHQNGHPCILIGVQDFGRGIEAEELSRIYEPFYRAAFVRKSQIPGTGLGLSLTRKMIENLGGKITAESSPGKGSTFRLHVPIDTNNNSTSPASNVPDSR